MILNFSTVLAIVLALCTLAGIGLTLWLAVRCLRGWRGNVAHMGIHFDDVFLAGAATFLISALTLVVAATSA